MLDTRDVGVGELCKAGPACFAIVPLRVCISTHNKSGYSNFGQDQTMLSL